MSRSMDWAQAAIVGCTLSPSARLVLLIVAQHADRNTGRNAWPSVARIAAASGYSRRTVQSALAELEADGLLIRQGKAFRGVTRWQLPLPCVQLLHTRRGAS